MNGGSPQRRSWDLRDALSLRIAIIGLGPKGLYALERLIDHLARARLAAEIDVFEPHPAPGAGPAYDPDEPSYLRMNFSAEHVDMWWREDASERHFVPAAEQLSFVEWSHARGVPCATDEYPARGVVGDYLADGGMRILRHAPDRLRIRVRRVRVDDLRRTASGWEVRSGGAGMGGFDEVLVTIGHQPGGEDALAASWHHFAPLVRTPFPVTAQLASRTVRPGAVVAVRGFALSFIDAALALTEGRGGSFAQTAHPFRLTYLHSAHEVAAIVPFSRTGHPMLPKPEPTLAASIPGLEQIAITWRDRLRNLPSPPNLEVDLLPVIASCGVGIWAAANGHADAKREERVAHAVGHWLGARANGERLPVSRVVPRIERALEIGAGLRRPDLPWTIGASWRALYPVLVERVGYGGLASDAWPRFARIATEMERLAFGPPPGNAAKFLALVDAGLIDLRFVAGGRLESAGGTTRIHAGPAVRPVDVVVDAVLGPPGAAGVSSPLLRALLAGQHIRIAPGRRGIEVTRDAQCVGADGGLTHGLSAIGRHTEDWIVGNDTLNRTLHDQPDRWARRVSLRAQTADPAQRVTLSAPS